MQHPRVIDGFEFAAAGGRLGGDWPVAGFPRLNDVLAGSRGTLRYELQGVPEHQGRRALRLRVEGGLELACQRCLAALEYPLRIDALLLLAATQAEIDAEPLAAEGPERIVGEREMRVHDLIEDEVLLALPIAPRHERCAAQPAAGAGQRQASPFAGLRGMLGGSKH